MKKIFIITVAAIIVIVAVVGSYLSFVQYRKNTEAEAQQKNRQIADLSGKLAENEQALKAAVERMDALAANQNNILNQAQTTKHEDLTLKLRTLDLKQFQSVHLTNDTVYFGKITEYNTDFVVLTDIYYLQGGYDDPSKPVSSGQAPPPISLVKRGNELHGPQDAMTINTANILYVETLKPESQVLRAIYQHEANSVGY